jgi:tight adherence protein B
VDLLAVVTVFAIVMLLVLFLGGALGSRGRMAEQALARLKPAGLLPDSLSHKRTADDKQQTLAILRRLDVTRVLEQNLWQAGIYIRVSELLLVMVLLFGMGEVFINTFLNNQLLAFGCSLAMAAAPIPYIRFRRQRRLKRFADQLPYALDLLKSLLEAGHSLLRGFQVLVKEFEDPIAGEFSTALEQASLGLPLSRALEEMVKRVPQEDLRMLVVAVKVQADAGSSLATIVGRLSEIMRARQRLRAQVKSLTAQGRMSGVIVALLPVLVMGVFSIIQPGYANSLFHDPLGKKMLATAAVLDVMALFTIRHLLKVRY